MDTQTAALALGVTNVVVVVLIAADRWVHRVTGGAPLEARIDAVERYVRDDVRRHADTVRDDARRHAETVLHLGTIDIALAEIKTELRFRKRRTEDEA